ncbi:hypothetical protein C0992_011481 [Termitomyces sp. T32_za158]|nr:hypothetical protein C0992_011481 [Termitomyces sp. T32_za158]
MEAPLPFSPQCITTSASIVHLEYDPDNLPPVPSQSWTRFVCISDTHTHSFPVPDGDVLLHSGDLTQTGLLSEFKTTIDWICSLPHKVKIVIAGNHDLTLHTDWYDRAHNRFHRKYGKQDLAPILELLTGENARKSGLIYLQDASCDFKVRPDGRTWTVYGSPMFDMNREENYVGCEDLRARLPHLRPRLHVFGHIHEARGAYVHAWGSNPEASPLPIAQNDLSVDDDDDDDEEVGQLPPRKVNEPPRNVNEGGDETVFVNAANWPAGLGAWRGTHRVPFGGPGYQAIVVDLHD